MLTTLCSAPALPSSAEKSKTSSPVPVIAFFTVDSKANASVTTVRVGPEHQLIEVVGVGLVEPAAGRHQVERGRRREQLADRAPASVTWPPAGFRSIAVTDSVRPGDSATMPSPRSAAPKRNSMAPFENSTACAVIVCGRSKPGTAHQVTVVASGALSKKTRPPADGSRSAKKGAIRGAPEARRPRPRAVDALSASSNVRLPSELTNSDVKRRP